MSTASSISNIQASIDLARHELDILRHYNIEEAIDHKANIVKTKSGILQIINRTKTVEARFYEYSSAMEAIQVPSPPNYVLQKQSLTCRALHRLETQSRLVELAKSQCTELIRTIRSNMHDLEDECADLENQLLQAIDEAKTEAEASKVEMDKELLGQEIGLKELRDLLGSEEDGEPKEEQDPRDAEKDFTQAMNDSLSFFTSFFASTNKEKYLEGTNSASASTFMQESFNTLQLELPV